MNKIDLKTQSRKGKEITHIIGQMKLEEAEEQPTEQQDDLLALMDQANWAGSFKLSAGKANRAAISDRSTKGAFLNILGTSSAQARHELMK